MDKKSNLDSKFNVFSSHSKEKIRKIQELRTLISDCLLKNTNLDVILAGKNGLALFIVS